MRTHFMIPMLLVAAAPIAAVTTGATERDSANWRLRGDFQIRPTAFHQGAIGGKMTITRNEVKGATLELKLDAPLLGKIDFPSSEAWATRVGLAATERTVVAFKLKGPSHRWYFVVSASTFDGGITLNGPIYKAPATLLEVQAAAPTLATTIPPTWKQIGTTTLKEAP